MTDLYHQLGKNFKGEDIFVTIASGPVIVNEDKKFLLHISESTEKYQFTGGRLNDSQSPQQNAINRPFEDLGLQVMLTEGVDPLIVTDEIERDGKVERLVLMHYVAIIPVDAEIGECQWFSIDEIRELEKQGQLSSLNVRIACEHFLK